MSKAALKRYAPLYISILVTGLIMVLLFLRPDSALGLSLEVDTPQNERNSQAGFKLNEPVVINTRVKLLGDLEDITEITLAIEKEIGGDPGFINITGDTIVTIASGDASFTDTQVPPLAPAVSRTHDLTDQLPKSGGIPQGTLFVAIKFTEVILVPTNPLLGGYNYRGTGDTGGLLEYIITYTPPPIAGDYRATVTVETPSQTELRVTKFSVLRELAAAALNTLYPISSGEALPGDLVILQLTLPNTDADDASSVTASGDLISGNLSMIAASKFHPALRAKWDVAPAANFLLPLKVPEDAVPGTFNHFVKVEDKAGQIVSLGSVGVAAKVKLVSARSTFNIYLLPRFNFITPALECFPFAAATVCTGSAGSVVEFDIEKLLLQTVPISKVDPAFLATIGHTPASGDVPLSRIVQLAFRFDATPGDFDVFDVETSTGIPPSFDSLKAGRGYILKTTGDGGIDPFARTSDASNSQFPGIGIPVPLKVTFTGKVIADPGGQLATFDVERRWNLVGPHSERDTSVGVFLNPVAIPDVVWEQLIAFNNLLDISLDENGNMKLLAGGAPEIVFLEEQFRTLLGPPFSDDPKGDSVTAGGGFWLFMCERPAPTCQGGELLPVLD